jgi:hypothetical protein
MYASRAIPGHEPSPDSCAAAPDRNVPGTMRA